MEDFDEVLEEIKTRALILILISAILAVVAIRLIASYGGEQSALVLGLLFVIHHVIYRSVAVWYYDDEEEESEDEDEILYVCSKCNGAVWVEPGMRVGGLFCDTCNRPLTRVSDEAPA